ncbi:MAG: thioredoxin family protein [Prochlorococcus sp.]|nr:thioredoxin family protein [Prochlorococcaceae cyanobacterium ETNP14_MAG_5]
MALTPSTMLPLGTPLPSFELDVVSGTNRGIDDSHSPPKKISSSTLPTKPLLLMVLCAHCPFVKHIEAELTRLDQDYRDSVQLLAIASNSLITHPQDGPEQLAAQAKQQSWRFPYLLDPNQSLAKALQAACTPDFFLFAPSPKGQQELRYRGQLDNSRPGNNVAVTGSDLRAALDAVLNGQEVCIDQQASIGCNIKWHPGQEPTWFG